MSDESTPQKESSGVSVLTIVLFFTLLIGVFFAAVYYQKNYRVAHTMINAPFDEELYKYNMFQEYRKFKDEFDGKFELVARQLGGHNPLNITFYNSYDEVLSSADIRNMKSEDLVQLIRDNNVYENPHKDTYVIFFGIKQ